MASTDRDPLDRFDDYLDAQAAAARRQSGADGATGDLDPILSETVRRLRALDAADAPAPTLAMQIWEELLNQRGLAAAIPLTITGATPALNGRNAPHPRRAFLPAMPVAKQRRRWAMAQVAAALLMIVALIAVYFAMRPNDDQAVAPSDATPTTIAAPTIPHDVPMFRANPAHTGEMPGPGPDPNRPIRERWSFTTDGVVYGAPAVVDGVVYVGTLNGSFYAIDAASGAQRWMFAADGAVFTSPAVVDGIVYLGSDEGGKVYALDAVSGAQRWSLTTGGSVLSCPTVVGGVVYVGSEDGTVYALDARTGEQRWTFATGGPVDSSPAVVDGVVYVGNGNYRTAKGNVYALDAASGEQRWLFPTGDAVTSSPAVVDGIVYVGGSDDNVYAIDATSGEQRWSFTTDDDVPSSPAVVDGIVYVGNGTIHAVKGTLYAIDAATGEQRWMFATGGNIFASPVVVGGVVYIGSWDHNLYALDAASGEQRWSFTTGDHVTSSAAVLDGIVYVGGEDAKVYALESAPARAARGRYADLVAHVTTDRDNGPGIAPAHDQEGEIIP